MAKLKICWHLVCSIIKICHLNSLRISFTYLQMDIFCHFKVCHYRRITLRRIKRRGRDQSNQNLVANNLPVRNLQLCILKLFPLHGSLTVFTLVYLCFQNSFIFFFLTFSFKGSYQNSAIVNTIFTWVNMSQALLEDCFYRKEQVWPNWIISC